MIYHFYVKKKKKIEKVEKLVANLRDKTEHIINIRDLTWLKSNIDMNTELRSKAKIDFEKKFFFKLMNNAVFGKNMEMY